MDVLVEDGYCPGGRCGVRDLEIARAVRATPGLRLVGVEGYEGLLQTLPAEQEEPAAANVLRFVADLATACDREGDTAAHPSWSATPATEANDPTPGRQRSWMSVTSTPPSGSTDPGTCGWTTWSP
jgi:D-serine deaminase-like pyridoxal phosphate-dependent protein